MAAFTTLANGKGAAVISCDALNFVFSTTRPTQKDQTHDYYHAARALV